MCHESIHQPGHLPDTAGLGEERKRYSFDSSWARIVPAAISVLLLGAWGAIRSHNPSSSSHPYTPTRTRLGLRSGVGVGLRTPFPTPTSLHPHTPTPLHPHNSTPTTPPTGIGYSTLSPLEEQIIQHPSTSPVTARELRRLLDGYRVKRHPLSPSLQLGKPPRRSQDDMGWVWPDEVYWKRIPPEARQVPADWTQFPGVRFRNTEIDGIRQVWLRRGKDYDQWLLSDPLHEVKACISLDKKTRQIYFMQFRRRRTGQWRLEPAADNCYSCHASGLRVIRPFQDPRVDQKTLAEFNRLILSYGVCDFGGSINPATRGKLIQDDRCNSCHNGVQRGKLYQIHKTMILFKAERDRTMPPGLEG